MTGGNGLAPSFCSGPVTIAATLIPYLQPTIYGHQGPISHLRAHYPNLIAIVCHYSDAIMGTMAYQITSLTIVYSTGYSGADQRKHQSPASLAFVRGIHRGPVNSPHNRPVTRKMFPYDDVIMCCSYFTNHWPVMTQFFTCHCVLNVVTYAETWFDLSIIFFTYNRDFNIVWITSSNCF